MLQLPILLFLGLAFSSALTTHKITSVALGVGATLRHAKEHSLNYHFTLFILARGLSGVVTGALAIGDNSARLTLGILTTGLGLYSLFKSELG